METTEVSERELKETKTAILGKIEEMKTASGSAVLELKTKIDALQTQYDALDVKLAQRHAAGIPEQLLTDALRSVDGLERFMQNKSGSFAFRLDEKQVARIFERKTVIDSAAVGASVSGVLQIDRTSGIVTEARQALSLRSVLSARPTTMPLIDFIKVNAPLAIASPQIETHTKRENAVTFTTVSEKVRTLATWIPATRQVLDDMTELGAFLETGLRYEVDLAEEQQLLSGSGSGEDLNGLITQGTLFNTALLPLSGSYNRIDVIGRAIQQVTTAKELQPTFIVLHPVDYWAIRLTKDTQGRYILGDPMQPNTVPNLFGLAPIVTTSIAQGTFLLGSGSPIASEIRDRMEMTVEIATQHEDYFARNMVAIRAEKRLALVVYRPGSYIRGSFVTSP